MKIIIPATIHRGNPEALKQLMRDWSLVSVMLIREAIKIV